MDFPVTRAVIERLPTWIDTFTETLSPPAQVSLEGGFKWEHREKTAELAQVTKAVRLATGLRAALFLADQGLTPECYSILRMVSDYASEIFFIGEGLLAGKMTKEQERFVEQHFSTMPLTPDELAEREREYYIGRREMEKARGRLAERAGMRKDDYAKIVRFLQKGYDRYVHGTYGSAMELFTGENMRFMLTGTHSARQVCAARTAVAGKLVEGLAALRLMAMTRGMVDLAASLRESITQIDSSGEQEGTGCEKLDLERYNPKLAQ
jgi:hypothetical protein